MRSRAVWRSGSTAIARRPPPVSAWPVGVESALATHWCRCATDASGHAWLHRECWPVWHGAREAETIVALASMGIRSGGPVMSAKHQGVAIKGEISA